MKNKKDNDVRLQSAQKFVEFLHGDSQGLMFFAQLENKSMKRQQSFPINKALEQTYNWIELDCYFSLNAFKNNRRKTENALRLNALYTDLDFYKIGIDIDEARSKIDDLIGAEEIPIPNVIIYSGRGLQLVWLIDLMVYNENYLKLWNRMQQAIYHRLQCLNSDSAARSVTQLFRLPGSIHSITNTVVKAEYLKEIRYTITDLKDSLLEELPKDWRQQVENKKIERVEKEKKLQKKGDEGAAKCNLTLSSMHSARLKDLDKLLYIRAGKVRRRRFVFYYAAISRSNNIDVGVIRKSLERINKLFYKPLTKGVIDSAIKSGEYKFTTDFLIKNLKITPDEQQVLISIIDINEKKRRKRIANELDRRAKGVQSKQEYNCKRAEQQKELMLRIAKYLDEGLKQKEIAKLLGISPGRVSQLVKAIKEV